jgi:anaerobic selenocysteine-containing dehydrogenase
MLPDGTTLPGGDIALAFGISRLLFETGQTDPDARSYCDHLEAFRAQSFSRSISDWAALADVSTGELEAVARLYADGPAAILVGWGMQRKTRGSATVRMLDALGAVSGNLGIAGGGVSFYFKRRGAFDLSFLKGLPAAPRAIPEPLLGRGILDATDPAIRMVWITAGNPVAMLPESLTVKRALETREFTVVVDSFLTDTALSAHLVLPTTTMLEDEDLVGAYGHHWIGEVSPVVDPPEGVRTDHDIIRSLARRLGMEGEFSGGVRAWMERMLPGPVLHSLREQGHVRNPASSQVLFADRKFPTATGRVNLIHDVDVEPEVPPTDRPLFLMAPSTEKAQSSQWLARHQGGPPVATVHPCAAAGMAEGELAEIESEVGSLAVRIRLDARQRRDVVLLPKGGWLSRGACANALVPARETDRGGGAVYYDTPVRILRQTSRKLR